MFEVRLRSANHVRRYSVHSVDAGWEVTLEEDRKPQRHDVYQDWHRVERALALIEQEVDELTRQGWWIATDPSVDEAIA